MPEPQASTPPPQASPDEQIWNIFNGQPREVTIQELAPIIRQSQYWKDAPELHSLSDGELVDEYMVDWVDLLEKNNLGDVVQKLSQFPVKDSAPSTQAPQERSGWDKFWGYAMTPIGQQIGDAAGISREQTSLAGIVASDVDRRLAQWEAEGKPASWLERFRAGLTKGSAQFVEDMTSPLGIVTLGIGPKLAAAQQAGNLGRLGKAALATEKGVRYTYGAHAGVGAAQSGAEFIKTGSPEAAAQTVLGGAIAKQAIAPNLGRGAVQAARGAVQMGRGVAQGRLQEAIKAGVAGYRGAKSPPPPEQAAATTAAAPPVATESTPAPVAAPAAKPVILPISNARGQRLELALPDEGHRQLLQYARNRTKYANKAKPSAADQKALKQLETKYEPIIREKLGLDESLDVKAMATAYQTQVGDLYASKAPGDKPIKIPAFDPKKVAATAAAPAQPKAQKVAPTPQAQAAQPAAATAGLKEAIANEAKTANAQAAQGAGPKKVSKQAPKPAQSAAPPEVLAPAGMQPGMAKQFQKALAKVKAGNPETEIELWMAESKKSGGIADDAQAAEMFNDYRALREHRANSNYSQIEGAFKDKWGAWAEGETAKPAAKPAAKATVPLKDKPHTLQDQIGGLKLSEPPTTLVQGKQYKVVGKEAELKYGLKEGTVFEYRGTNKLDGKVYIKPPGADKATTLEERKARQVSVTDMRDFLGNLREAAAPKGSTTPAPPKPEPIKVTGNEPADQMIGKIAGLSSMEMESTFPIKVTVIDKLGRPLHEADVATKNDLLALQKDPAFREAANGPYGERIKYSSGSSSATMDIGKAVAEPAPPELLGGARVSTPPPATEATATPAPKGGWKVSSKPPGVFQEGKVYLDAETGDRLTFVSKSGPNKLVFRDSEGQVTVLNEAEAEAAKHLNLEGEQGGPFGVKAQLEPNVKDLQISQALGTGVAREGKPSAKPVFKPEPKYSKDITITELGKYVEFKPVKNKSGDPVVYVNQAGMHVLERMTGSKIASGMAGERLAWAKAMVDTFPEGVPPGPVEDLLAQILHSAHGKAYAQVVLGTQGRDLGSVKSTRVHELTHMLYQKAPGLTYGLPGWEPSKTLAIVHQTAETTGDPATVAHFVNKASADGLALLSAANELVMNRGYTKVSTRTLLDEVMAHLVGGDALGLEPKAARSLLGSMIKHIMEEHGDNKGLERFLGFLSRAEARFGKTDEIYAGKLRDAKAAATTAAPPR